MFAGTVPEAELAIAFDAGGAQEAELATSGGETTIVNVEQESRVTAVAMEIPHAELADAAVELAVCSVEHDLA